MGIRGISIGSIAIILLIALIIFGTKRLRSAGEDIGTAVKGFRKGMSEDQDDNQNKQ